jgi:hypothetical protein
MKAIGEDSELMNRLVTLHTPSGATVLVDPDHIDMIRQADPAVNPGAQAVVTLNGVTQAVRETVEQVSKLAQKPDGPTLS